MIFTEAGQPFETVIQHAPTGLAGVIGVRLLDQDGNVVIARSNTGITEMPAGSGIYRKILTAPLTQGNYLVLWDTDPGGAANPSNSASEEVMVTVGAIVGVIPAAGALPGGPCEAWISGTDVSGYCQVTSPDADEMTMLAGWASQLLYGWSGRIFGGRCSTTVRPCRRACDCFSGFPGYGWAWSQGAWFGLPSSSYYLNSMPSPVQCGCGCLTRVRLPYPARHVTQVRIDGVVVDPSAYRIDGRKWLVRVDGAAVEWPACQDLSLPAGTPGTFEIDVQYGSRPPMSGIRAALALACQLNRFNNQGQCDLPANVTQVIRQGVTMQTSQVLRLTKDGFVTGIPAIDVFLHTYNASKVRRRPAIWSPDVQQTARKVGQ